MKKYKNILILPFIALSFSIIPILTSCCNNTINNVNFYIKSSIGDNICFQNDNVELSVVSNLENLESYQFSWECPQLNNYEFSSSFVINFLLMKLVNLMLKFIFIKIIMLLLLQVIN